MTESEANRLLSLTQEEFEAEIGQAILDDEGILNASPHSRKELVDICRDWWAEYREEACQKLLSREHVKSAIHKGIGLNPTGRLIAIYAVLHSQNPALAPFQITFLSIMLVRETLKDICPE